MAMYAKSSENADVDASELWLLAPFHVVDVTDRAFVRDRRRRLKIALTLVRWDSSLLDGRVLREWGVARAHGVARLVLPHRR